MTGGGRLGMTGEETRNDRGSFCDRETEREGLGTPEDHSAAEGRRGRVLARSHAAVPSGRSGARVL